MLFMVYTYFSTAEQPAKFFYLVVQAASSLLIFSYCNIWAYHLSAYMT